MNSADDERRPGQGSGVQMSAVAGDVSKVRGLSPESAVRVTGVVEVRLGGQLDEYRQRPEGADRRSLARLHEVPDGATVRVVVGPRYSIGSSAFDMLRAEAHRLAYEVVGEPDAVQRWVTALRTGHGPWEAAW